MSLDPSWNAAGAHAVPNASDPGLRNMLSPLHGIASLSALKGISAPERVGMDGIRARVVGGAAQGGWRWKESSALTGDDLLVVKPTDNPTLGAWVREQGALTDLILPFLFSTADAAVLYTVPVGFTLLLHPSTSWEITTSMTGGTTPAIGLSSSQTGLSTKGDILGGASGDLTATLVSTGATYKGTVGAKMGKPGAILKAGSTIRFDRIADAFTAGAGNAHVFVNVLASP